MKKWTHARVAGSLLIALGCLLGGRPALAHAMCGSVDGLAPDDATSIVGKTHPSDARGFAVAFPWGSMRSREHANKRDAARAGTPDVPREELTENARKWTHAVLERSVRGDEGPYEPMGFAIEVPDVWTILLVPDEPLRAGHAFRLFWPRVPGGLDEDLEVFFTTRIVDPTPYVPRLVFETLAPDPNTSRELLSVVMRIEDMPEWLASAHVEFDVDAVPHRFPGRPDCGPAHLWVSGYGHRNFETAMYLDPSKTLAQGYHEEGDHVVRARLRLPGTHVVYTSEAYDVALELPPPPTPPSTTKVSDAPKPERDATGCGVVKANAPASCVPLAPLFALFALLAIGPRAHPGRLREGEESSTGPCTRKTR